MRMLPYAMNFHLRDFTLTNNNKNKQHEQEQFSIETIFIF
jgi:hypothetical protein